ncbi:MAG TPA: PqqD family protein [Gemmatimonadales bacterium]|nr:PqqD family protein [Gemmatimonadales bacterium]
MPAARIPEDVLTAHLPGEAVLLHLGTKRYYRLNETGAAIWRELEAKAGREHIVSALCERFEVSRDDAEAAVQALLTTLEAQGLLQTAADE